jgi:hypothetical protein
LPTGSQTRDDASHLLDDLMNPAKMSEALLAQVVG